MITLAVILAILATAWSCQRRYHVYPSFRQWWNAEGLPVWMMVAVILFALLTSRFFEHGLRFC